VLVCSLTPSWAEEPYGYLYLNGANEVKSIAYCRNFKQKRIARPNKFSRQTVFVRVTPLIFSKKYATRCRGFFGD
jgi:hypothetical protein